MISYICPCVCVQKDLLNGWTDCSSKFREVYYWSKEGLNIPPPAAYMRNKERKKSFLKQNKKIFIQKINEGVIPNSLLGLLHYSRGKTK